MSRWPAEFAPLLSLLPEDRVGAVENIEPITMGLSGAGVYAVSAATLLACTRSTKAPRALHALDTTDVVTSDPVAYARGAWQSARARPGFPDWAALQPVIDGAGAALARAARRVVSHNDMNPGNILWDGTRAWLVDWEAAGLNHPHYDLAAFAMFLRLDDDSAFGLAARHDGAALAEQARATFKALRRLAAGLCGLIFLRMVDDLTIRPAPARADAPSLGDCYAEMRTGQFNLREPRDRASFGLAL